MTLLFLLYRCVTRCVWIFIYFMSCDIIINSMLLIPNFQCLILYCIDIVKKSTIEVYITMIYTETLFKSLVSYRFQKPFYIHNCVICKQKQFYSVFSTNMSLLMQKVFSERHTQLYDILVKLIRIFFLHFGLQYICKKFNNFPGKSTQVLLKRITKTQPWPQGAGSLMEQDFIIQSYIVKYIKLQRVEENISS